MISVAQIAAWALSHWKLIAGGLAVLALSIALGIARHDVTHWHTIADQRAATIAQFAEAQKLADAVARKAIAAKEQQYKEQADDADTKHTDQLADARTAADRYIAAHRVPSCSAGGAPSRPAASAQGDGAAVPASLPATTVMVSPDDVQACSAAAKYALDAHDWAVGLTK